MNGRLQVCEIKRIGVEIFRVGVGQPWSGVAPIVGGRAKSGWPSCETRAPFPIRGSAGRREIGIKMMSPELAVRESTGPVKRTGRSSLQLLASNCARFAKRNKHDSTKPWSITPHLQASRVGADETA